MGGRFPRVILAVALMLTAAACGDDEATTTAASATSGAATTTTAAWGEAVAAGAGGLLGGARVLLREDFQDGDTAGWQVDSGWYLLENGERRMVGAGSEAWAWYPDGLAWSRYAARLAFRVDQGSLGVAVAVSARGRYVVHLSEAGVYLLKDAPFGTVEALGSAQPVALGESHVLAVGWDGGRVQVYVDGILLIDAGDPAPLSAGSIGLGASDGSAVVVDNILVAALAGPLPDLHAAGESADAALPPDLDDGGPEEGEGLDGGEDGDAGMPNLVMVAVSFPPAIGLEEPFDVDMTVRNTGDAAAGPFSVAFITWGPQCAGEVAGLGAGRETTATCRFPGFAADGVEFYGWTAGADSNGEVDEGGHEGDNAVSGTIILDGDPEDTLPNLSIGWVDWEPESPGPNEAFTLWVGISQTVPEWQGTLGAVGFSVLYEDGRTACRGTAAPSGGEFDGGCEVPAFGAPGEYWLTVIADAANEIGENDEDDNALIGAVLVSANALFVPNLTFLQMLANGGAPIRAGELFAADIVWDGNASSDLPPYTVRMLIDDVVVCSQDLTQPKGATACMVTAPAAAGSYVWTVQIDADDDLAESDEGDNDRSGVLRVED